MIFKSESSSELFLALSYCNNQKGLTHISSHLQFHYSYHFHPYLNSVCWLSRYLRLPTLTSAPVIPESEQMQKAQSIRLWILNRFVTNTDHAIEVNCVSSSFVVMQFIPLQRLLRLRVRSTSILSILCWYSCFFSLCCGVWSAQLWTW